MSVFFKDISPDNPVQAGDVEKLLQPLGLRIRSEESADYQRLLAAVHDCAERVSSLEDYQPIPDTDRFPRQNVRIPQASEQSFGHAWAHRFLIEGSKSARSGLKGKTVCLKDCIAVAGVPQFFGSHAFPAWTPKTDATVLQRILEAGADVHGTAVCESFCNSTASFTSSQGIIENPHQSGYSAGGSTSGGSALVAGGLIDFAIGTDQGGSIRVPASLCGCVGLKPTHGLVPYTGITSGDSIDDHAGPIARSVEEVAACLDAIAGYDGIDDRSLGTMAPGSYHFLDSLKKQGGRLEGLRVGVLREGIENDILQEGVRSAFFNAVQELASLGAVVSEASIPLHNEGPSIWTIQQRISGASGILGHANGRRVLGLTEFEEARLPWTADNFEKLFPSTKNTVINGLYLQDKFPGLYGKTVNIGRKIRDAYEAAFKNYDVLVMPTTPVVAPSTEDETTFSIPAGWAPAADDPSLQLPVGLQIVGGLWQEEKILRVAQAFEKGFDWKASKTASTATPEQPSTEALSREKADTMGCERVQAQVQSTGFLSSSITA